MSVPTISRARDLMASVIGCQNLRMYNEIWNGTELEKVYIAPHLARKIDAELPNNFFSHGYLTIYSFTGARLFVTAAYR
jgi:hypothetical protein